MQLILQETTTANKAITDFVLWQVMMGDGREGWGRKVVQNELLILDNPKNPLNSSLLSSAYALWLDDGQ